MTYPADVPQPAAVGGPFDTDSDAEASAPDTGPQPEGLPQRERDFIIPAQDSKGHHVRLYCRAMPAVGRLVSDVHASRKYPFRTIGDVVRWCITDGVKRLASGAGINSVMAHADAMIAVFQDEEFQLQFLEFFNHMQRVVNTYVETGAAGEARRVVALAQAQIARMPDCYWRDRYTEELARRYGTLMAAHGVTPGAFDLDGPRTASDDAPQREDVTRDAHAEELADARPDAVE